MAQLKSGFSRAKTEHQKRALAQTVGGKLLKKYRLMSMAKTVGCSRRLLNSKGLGRMRRKSAVSDELMKHVPQFYLREDKSASTQVKRKRSQEEKSRSKFTFLGTLAKTYTRSTCMKMSLIQYPTLHSCV